MEIESQALTINGIRTPIDQSAPPEKSNDNEAVIFVHGNPGSRKDWQQFVPLTGQFSRAIAPDMPGYGQAERPRNFSYTIEGYANHLHALIQALGITKVHLVLHDFGGPWGLQFAANHPELVKSVVLVNIGILPGYTWHAYARIWRTPILGELFQLLATKWAFRMLLNNDNPKPFPREFIDRMYEDSDWALSKGMLKLYRATSNLSEFTDQISTALKRINLPALVLWGEGDKYMPVKFAQMQKNYFDADVHHMPECGHWPMIDNPDLFAHYLIPFLEKQIEQTVCDYEESAAS